MKDGLGETGADVPGRACGREDGARRRAVPAQTPAERQVGEHRRGRDPDVRVRCVQLRLRLEDVRPLSHQDRRQRLGQVTRERQRREPDGMTAPFGGRAPGQGREQVGGLVDLLLEREGALRLGARQLALEGQDGRIRGGPAGGLGLGDAHLLGFQPDRRERGVDLGTVRCLGNHGVRDVSGDHHARSGQSVALLVDLRAEPFHLTAIAPPDVQGVADGRRQGEEVVHAARGGDAWKGEGAGTVGGLALRLRVELGKEDPVAGAEAVLAPAQARLRSLEARVVLQRLCDDGVELGAPEEPPPVGRDGSTLGQLLALAAGRHRLRRRLRGVRF